MAWNDFLFCMVTMTLTGSLAYAVILCLRRPLRQVDVRYRKQLLKLVVVLFLVPVIYLLLLQSRYVYAKGVWIHRGEFGMKAPKEIREIFWVAGVVWIVGLIIGVIIRAYQYMCFRRILRCNHQSDDLRWEWALLSGKEKYGIRDLEVFENELVTSPMITGTFHPKLIIPVQDFTEKEIQMMMEHELYHVHCRDLLWKKLGLWMTWLHWFNPLVYRLLKHMMFEQEQVCDLTVCEQGEGFTAREYCELLYELEPGEYGAIFSTALYESTSDLGRRIEALKERKRYFVYKRWMAVIGCLILIMVSLIPAYGMSEVLAKQEEEWREQYIVATEIESHVTKGIVQERDNGSVCEMWVENVVALYGTSVWIELNAVANTRYLYSDRELNAGDSIVIAVTSNDSSAPFRIGIKNIDTGVLTYISGTDTLVGTFTAETAGTYSAFIENNAQYEVSFSGSIIYPH